MDWYDSHLFFLDLSGVSRAQHLSVLAAVAVDRDALAAKFVGQHVGPANILNRG